MGSVKVKKFLKNIPIVGYLLVFIKKKLFGKPFHGSEDYWKKRYASGGYSGPGSVGALAQFKADFLNDFVEKNSISSVIEFGSGDGSQLALAKYPIYTGVDISPTAIQKCNEKFQDDVTKHFRLLTDYQGETAELALSLDVIYHLVEDNVYFSYMTSLFAAASRFVIVYSSNTNEQYGDDPHVRNRVFVDWVKENAPQWLLVAHIPNKYPYEGDPEKGSMADFFVFERH